MPRAQCLVVRDKKILLMKHRHNNQEWWCLPGGGIDQGETPEKAAIRELKEDCNVEGRIIRMISHNSYKDDDEDYTFLIDIGDQEPKMGADPELINKSQIIADMQWLALNEIPERDRCFLWAAGLIGAPGMVKEIEAWGNDISYPKNKVK